MKHPGDVIAQHPPTEWGGGHGWCNHEYIPPSGPVEDEPFEFESYEHWGLHVAAAIQKAQVVDTQTELDKLPVGCVVMALWCSSGVPLVCTRYSDGWYAPRSANALLPLGSGRRGNSVRVLWRPDWEVIGA